MIDVTVRLQKKGEAAPRSAATRQIAVLERKVSGEAWRRGERGRRGH